MRAAVATSPGTGRTMSPTLRASFHKHLYTLGEHYNSVVPASEISGEEAEAWSVSGTPPARPHARTPAQHLADQPDPLTPTCPVWF